jgi:3',5'-cyclic AMP phosphodiesterase CpdA
MPVAILYLTDLHLGDANPGAMVDDYRKSEIVPVEDRTTRKRLLGNTLQEVGSELRRQRKTLDAIVVGGDITYNGDPGGYEELGPLLGRLGESLPDRNRIVVVPGNHDVKWGTLPDSDDRYELFRRFVVDEGYVTPPLIADEVVDRTKHFLVDEARGFVVVPFNSSNLCGVLEPLGDLSPDDIDAALTATEAARRLRRRLYWLRLYDAARIASGHLSTARSELAALDPHDQLVRIAVLHHHLLPVDTSEEVKPFDGLINLGAFRTFLRDNCFSLVLHGHKHSAAAYYDHLAAPGEPSAAEALVTLVVSGSTLGGADGIRRDCFRLLELDTRKQAPSAAITAVDAIDPGGAWIARQPRTYRLWQAPSVATTRSAAPKTIRGANVDSVYIKLVQLAASVNQADPALSIVCHIEDGGPPMLPVDYPVDFLQGADPEQWLRETVSWWQRPGRSRRHGDLLFSHGDRIRRFDNEHDQFERVMEVLRSPNTYSGHCVIALLDPRKDGVRDATGKFPAFVNAQFVKRPVNAGYAIDCIGYYRKQELRYWWPVNVAELCAMQHEAVDKLGEEYSTGSLTTFTAIGYAGSSAPRVAVPRIDRLHEEDPDVLTCLALHLVGHPLLDPAAAESRWREDVLRDLVPPPMLPAGDPPIALDGLKALSDAVHKLAEALDLEHPREVASVLEDLYGTNREFAEGIVGAPINDRDYQRWRESATRQCKRIEAAVRGCMDAL